MTQVADVVHYDYRGRCNAAFIVGLPSDGVGPEAWLTFFPQEGGQVTLLAQAIEGDQGWHTLDACYRKPGATPSVKAHPPGPAVGIESILWREEDNTQPPPDMLDPKSTAALETQIAQEAAQVVPGCEHPAESRFNIVKVIDEDGNASVTYDCDACGAVGLVLATAPVASG